MDPNAFQKVEIKRLNDCGSPIKKVLSFLYYKRVQVFSYEGSMGSKKIMLFRVYLFYVWVPNEQTSTALKFYWIIHPIKFYIYFILTLFTIKV